MAQPEARRQDNPTYENVTRRVGLLRVANSDFADSVADFVRGLGLQVAEVDALGPENLVDTVSAVEKVAETCATAVLVLESAVIQESFAGPGSGRTAELSGQATALLAFAMQTFEPERLVLVKQRADPLMWNGDSLPVCLLSDEGGAAKSFRKALQNAGAMIEGRRFQMRGGHKFEFPQEWWAQELDGSDSRAFDVPSFTEFLVDSVFNRELTQTKLKDEARQQIRARQRLDLKYHYVGWKAAKIWDELTIDQKYAHQPHIKQIVKAAPDFLPQIAANGPFNYVSLGPGGGDTDAEVLKALAGSLDIASLFLVDVSIELLQIAANQIISQVLERHVLQPPPRVRAILSDFEDSLSKLAPILMARDIQSLFTLLGFTIGNGSEMEVLRGLNKGTRPGDYVLFDARLHKHGDLGPNFSLSETERQELVAPYDTDTLRAFAFSPVEEASDYAVRLSDSFVKVDLIPRWGHGFTSAVPSAINVYVECSGIYENESFMESMEIMPPRRRSGDDPEVLQLATLTFYHLPSLARWIETSGEFKVVWQQEFDGSGLILLERV